MAKTDAQNPQEVTRSGHVRGHAMWARGVARLCDIGAAGPSEAAGSDLHCGPSEAAGLSTAVSQQANLLENSSDNPLCQHILR